MRMICAGICALVNSLSSFKSSSYSPWVIFIFIITYKSFPHKLFYFLLTAFHKCLNTLSRLLHAPYPLSSSKKERQPPFIVPVTLQASPYEHLIEKGFPIIILHLSGVNLCYDILGYLGISLTKQCIFSMVSWKYVSWRESLQCLFFPGRKGRHESPEP